jgi:AraC-like DNA-binding protein
VASLAAEAGVSRAGLARRFSELVGEPPMSYLTGWRLTLAADLLRSTDATVESVARKVGYSGSFALSAAFKRVRGISPQEHRRATAG